MSVCVSQTDLQTYQHPLAVTDMCYSHSFFFFFTAFEYRKPGDPTLVTYKTMDFDLWVFVCESKSVHGFKETKKMKANVA